MIATQESVVMLDPVPQAAGVQSNAPFFILGSPRSGTTLLVQILNRHSRLFIPPETEFFYLLNRYGLLNRPFGAMRALRFIDAYLASRPASMLGLPELPGLRQRLLENASSYREVFIRLMDILNEPSGKPRWGEKTPHHLHVGEAILAEFPQAPVLAVLRDGRAVTRSRLQKTNWEQNLFGAAKLWRNDSQRLRRLLRNHGERILIVRYEDLVRDPKPVIAQVCEFIGETFEPRMLESVESIEPRFQAYYGQSWMAKSKGAIDPSRMEAWRTAFSRRELSLINHVQRSELRHWGYPLDQDASGGWRLLLVREQFRHLLHRVKRKIALLSSIHVLSVSRRST